mmetsp:Transcript_2956/g.10779  ORF Transcript_2956/g.10779 Transcript_2956/m.10779 type:complete len:112 (+) Transcript_2956:574-909(+)
MPETIQSFQPQLVLYDAGVDTHKCDRLGRLSLSDEGLARREMLVLDTCVGYGIPTAAVVGGGYDDSIDELAARHEHLHRAAAEVFHSAGLTFDEDDFRAFHNPIAEEENFC